MPLPFTEFIRKANEWAARNLLYIALVIAGLMVVAFCVANYYGSKVEEAVATNPPLPKREAKAIRKQSKQDSILAEAYKLEAIKYRRQADSALYLARHAKHEADLLRAQHEKLSTTPAGAPAGIQHRLEHYQSPD